MTPPALRIPVVVLAAGGSRRFGAEDKLLASVGGRSVLELTLEAALQVVDARDVVVVIPGDAPERAARVEALGARVMVAEHAARGMRWSIQAGLDVAIDEDDTAGVALLLADDPLAAAALGDVLDVASQLGGARIVAVDRRPPVPHPVYLPADLAARLATPHEDDDSGLRALLGSEPVHWIPGDGPAPIDVDVPTDLVRLQRRLHDRS